MNELIKLLRNFGMVYERVEKTDEDYSTYWVYFAHGRRAYRIRALMPTHKQLEAALTVGSAEFQASLLEVYGLEFGLGTLRAIEEQGTVLETMTSPQKWEKVEEIALF